MSDTIKVRVTGERDHVKTMIEALDPVVDIVTDWRIFPQRNGTTVSAYLEARPHTTEEETSCRD
ncbi:hypothetical protein AB0L57_32095 [Nocardia sp. NPDC052254]|uniref:hypothetical protein n=1 Tax=Nocardia sp. NPDC052254 TaxID=3155681 RepID=UPI00342EA3B4